MPTLRDVAREVGDRYQRAFFRGRKMVILRRSLQVSLLVVALGGFGTADAGELENRLAKLIKEHPRVTEKLRAKEIAGHDIDQRRAAYLPRLDLSAGIGKERAEKPDFRQPRGAETLTRDDEELRLTYNLFRGYRDQANLAAAELAARKAEVELSNEQQALLLNGFIAHLRILQTRQLHVLAQANEETVKKQLALEDARGEKGTGIAVDVLLSKARLQVAQETRVSVEGLAHAASIRYRQLFGELPDIPALEDVKGDPSRLPGSLDGAYKIARSSHPLLLANKLQIEIAEQKKTAAAADYYPIVDLLGLAIREDNVDGARGVDETVSGQVRVRWNLYAGGETVAREKSARSEISLGRARLSRSTREIEEQVGLAWREYENAGERRKLLENASIIASEVMLAREKLRDAGRETAINVLNAKSELFRTQIKYVGADYSHRIASFRLLRAIGQLTPDGMGIGTK